MSGVYYPTLNIRDGRMWRHLLSGCFAGRKNSKASRRAMKALCRVYTPFSDKYLRGAHRLIREAIAESRRLESERRQMYWMLKLGDGMTALKPSGGEQG